MVLERIARPAISLHDISTRSTIAWAGRRRESFNTASEAAADILAKILIKRENRSVLDAALRGNELLAASLFGKLRSLLKAPRKDGQAVAQATGWVLRQLADLLRDNGLVISSPLRSSDPYCVLSRAFSGNYVAPRESSSGAGLGMQGNTNRAHAQRASFSWPATPSRANSRGKLVTGLTFSVTF